MPATIDQRRDPQRADVPAAPGSCCAHAAAPAPVPVAAPSCCAHAEAAPVVAAHADCCHGAEAAGQAPAAPTVGDGRILRAAVANTLVCLLGCSLGDVGMVVATRMWALPLAMTTVMVCAVAAGLVTSIALETVWLATGSRMAWGAALRRAAGMSLLSMIAMEVAMNVVDLGLSGGMRMTLPWAQYLGVLALGEVAGFLVPLPYNHWRLRYLGKACH
jgi:hypothetical protein